MKTKSNHLYIMLLALAMIILTASCDWSPEPVRFVHPSGDPYKKQLKFVSWKIYHTPWSLDVDRNNLFVCSNAFAIMDITNRKNPIELSCLRPLEKGIPNSVVVRNGYAYVAWSGHGIRVIDISNKRKPKIVVDNFNSSYIHKKLCLDYPYLYAYTLNIKTKEILLTAIDVSKPENPVVRGSFDLNKLDISEEHFPHEFIASKNHCFLTFGPKPTAGVTFKPTPDGQAKLYIINFSATSNPIQITAVDLGLVRGGSNKWRDPHLALAKKSKYLYITGPFANEPISDLKIVDVSQPANPKIVNSWNGFIKSADIDIQGNYAYITNYDNWLNVVDITNPTKPKNRGRVCAPFAYVKDYHVKVDGNYAYMNNWDAHSIYVVDLSDPDYPTVVNQIRFGHDMIDVSINGQYAYCSLWDWEQFFVVDVTKKESPKVIHRRDILGRGWGIYSNDNYAYLAMGKKNSHFEGDTGGLMIFDTTNPSEPQQIGYNPPDGDNADVQLYVDSEEKRAYIAIGEPHLPAYSEGGGGEYHSNKPGMRIVDVSDPHNPAQLGRYTTAAQCRGICKIRNFVFLAAREDGLHIIDVSDPQNPRLAGKWDPSDELARAVDVIGKFAIVAYDNSIRVVNIRNPAKPREISRFDFDQPCYDVVVQQRKAFVVTHNGLYVLDLLDPTEIMEIASVEDVFCRPPVHLDVKGAYVYVACHNGGLYIFELVE